MFNDFRIQGSCCDLSERRKETVVECPSRLFRVSMFRWNRLGYANAVRRSVPTMYEWWSVHWYFLLLREPWVLVHRERDKRRCQLQFHHPRCWPTYEFDLCNARQRWSNEAKQWRVNLQGPINGEDDRDFFCRNVHSWHD